MKKLLAVLGIAVMIGLSGCGDNNETRENSGNHMKHEDHAGMNHSGSGDVPAGLKQAEHPAFEVGSKAIIHSDHMEGMNGAKATIAGAYDTTVYSVSYTPTTGGEAVNNHKWVIHEEIKDARGKSYEPGDEVVLETDHMKGMKGAKATIDSAVQTTVYMVDYTPTTGGDPVKNHQWVTEDELSAQ